MIYIRLGTQYEHMVADIGSSRHGKIPRRQKRGAVYMPALM